MDSEDKLWLGFWYMVGVVIVSVVFIIASCTRHETEQFVKGGYNKCTLLGSNQSQWCK